MAWSPNGQAISAARRTRSECRRLVGLWPKAQKRGDLKTWRRAKAVLDYLDGRTVIALAEELHVTRGSINRWLQWFEAQGTQGLAPREHPDGAPRLTGEQMAEIAALILAGPEAGGFSSGAWTGPLTRPYVRMQPMSVVGVRPGRNAGCQ